MISRTPKKPETEQMFQDPIAQVFEDVDNENGQKADPQPDQMEQFAKQLADMQTRLNESEKANMALLSQPQWSRSQVEQVQEVKPESVELPDPALDPNGYDQAIAARNRIRADNDQRRRDNDARRQADVKERVDDLWAAFGEAYPDMASDQERVDFVSTAVAKEAQRRGIDVEKYMFLTRDKFFADVAKKYVKVFGEPEGEDDEADLEDSPRQRRAAPRTNTRRRTTRRDREEDEYGGRTAGVFGGNESGGRPSRQDRDEDTGPTMIDDIYAIQKKTGFF